MTIRAKFAGRCTKCGQGFPVGADVIWSKGVKGAAHAVCPRFAAAPVVAAPVAPPVEVAGAVAIAQFLQAATARGLKFPKARFIAPGGGEIRVYRAGAGSKAPGSIQVIVRDEWVGRIGTDNVVVGPKLLNDRATLDALGVIAADVVTAAKAYGVLTGRCAFCNLELSDEGSVEVGYGPICAKHHGLPHTPKGRPDGVQAMPAIVAAAATAPAPKKVYVGSI